MRCRKRSAPKLSFEDRVPKLELGNETNDMGALHVTRQGSLKLWLGGALDQNGDAEC